VSRDGILAELRALDDFSTDDLVAQLVRYSGRKRLKRNGSLKRRS
jgi:hypothetical protein